MSSSRCSSCWIKLICHSWFCLKVPHMNKVDDIRYDKADSERSKHYKQPEAKSTKGPARKGSEQVPRSKSILGNQRMFVLDHQRRIDRWLWKQRIYFDRIPTGPVEELPQARLPWPQCCHVWKNPVRRIFHIKAAQWITLCLIFFHYIWTNAPQLLGSCEVVHIRFKNWSCNIVCFLASGESVGLPGHSSSRRATAVHMCPQTGFPLGTLVKISEICCLVLLLQILAFPNYKDFIQNM